jgi:very-short-patch-repair endonuclease
MPRGEVLVAIMNAPADMELAREAGWYRIPVSSVRKLLKGRWPPRWLAFYQTKVFGPPEAYAVNYCAAVQDIRKVSRQDLFPDTPPDDPKSIPTTLDKFESAVEINDLWDESPLEDRLWAILKEARIRAERQYPVTTEEQTYFLDFAIFCTEGNIDVETDGDTYHIGPEHGERDNQRNNALASKGWHVIRFTTKQIHEQPVEYCVSKVEATINRLKGLDHTTGVPVRYDPGDPLGPQQLSLFDQD